MVSLKSLVGIVLGVLAILFGVPLVLLFPLGASQTCVSSPGGPTSCTTTTSPIVLVVIAFVGLVLIGVGIQELYPYFSSSKA